MSSDQNRPDDPIEESGTPMRDPEPSAEDAVSAVFDPLMQQLQPDELAETPPVQEPGDTLAEPSPHILPADRPGASATTGTGTSIAVGCVAVCAVILLITILILTIVS
jgi:hypothetical protein